MQRQSERGFIQLSVFSQANLLLHSKQRTGLSSRSAVFSEHSQDKVPDLIKRNEFYFLLHGIISLFQDLVTIKNIPRKLKLKSDFL